MQRKTIWLVGKLMVGVSLIIIVMMLPSSPLQTNVLMISKMQKNQPLEETIKSLKISHLVLPELDISEKKVEFSEESRNVLQNLEKLTQKPLLLLSVGKKRESAMVLIGAESDPKKKQVLLWRMYQVLQKVDGISINFEGIFETFSFTEKLQLEKMTNDIRTLAKNAKKLVAGNGKNDLKFQNRKDTTVWYLNQERKSLSASSVVGKHIPEEKKVLPPRNEQKVNIQTLPEVLVIPSKSRDVFGGGASAGGPPAAPQPVPPPTPAPTPVFSFIPKKKFSTYVQNHGARRPQEFINEMLSEGFSEVYVSNYEPEWTGEFIHLLKASYPTIKVSVIAEGDCALAIDPTCGNKNLTIYKDPNRVLETTNIKQTNAWLLKYGSSGEKVEGIHYDVEAYLGPGSFYQCDHSGSFGKCTIDDVLSMVDLAFVPLQAQGYQQSMVWGSSRNTTPDQASSYSADLLRLFASTGFQKSVGQLVILAYSDQFSNIDVQPTFQAAETLCQKSSFCPQIIPVIETDHVPAEPSASFFEEGRQAAERMLVLTQNEEGQLASYAGQGVDTLLSYHEPALVNRAVFPGNIENEGDVKIVSVQASSSELSPAKNSITFTVNYNQTALNGVLSLQVLSLAHDKILVDASSQAAAGGNQTASLNISYQNFAQEPEGSYEVNLFLTSQKYFDRTRKKANNIQTFFLKKTVSPPKPPALSIPIIFGFSQPSDITSPNAAVEQQITDQVKKGVMDVPVYLGGNITPDGNDLKNGGQTPDFTAFNAMLSKIEKNLNFPDKSIRIRGYLRASLTAADASAQASGPGKTSIMNPSTRQNIKTLIQQIATQKKYGIDSSRLDLITFDFEDLLASNYDPADLAPSDEGFVNQIADFVKEIKQMNLGKKIGVYTTGIINKNWFPNEKAIPTGSPCKDSPRNFISKEDAQSLFAAGVDTLTLGAYVIFPLKSPPSCGADPTLMPNPYEPFQDSYESYLRFHIQTIKDLNLNPSQNIIIVISVFSANGVVTPAISVTALQSILSSNLVNLIQAEAFDFGSLDVNERTLILNAEQ